MFDGGFLIGWFICNILDVNLLDDWEKCFVFVEGLLFDWFVRLLMRWLFCFGICNGKCKFF